MTTTGTWTMTPPASATTPPPPMQSQKRAWWVAAAAVAALLLLLGVVVFFTSLNTGSGETAATSASSATPTADTGGAQRTATPAVGTTPAANDTGWTQATWFAVLFGSVSAICLIFKEVFNTFALSSGFNETSKNRAKEIAAGCSVFGLIFGAPTVAATIIALTAK
ncbi:MULTISPECIES: hypothetical protein [unclassified Rathayibacter]|uniref:hypothetical protein n=1 Tax=unclassified Rathayibacter TaxID=2609250 RepID=UPI0011AFFB6C|nr:MULTISPECIES: hypothetical protein [unclassified Rathayibacter]